jgi:ABC-type oligopeptide transport system ATPase subunit
VSCPKDPFLSFRGVKKNYLVRDNNLLALDGISLDVEEGKFKKI